MQNFDPGSVLDLALAKEFARHLPGVSFRGVFETSYRISYIGEGCTQLLGYTPEEICGDNGISLADLVHPHDREMMREKRKIQFENHQPFVNEFRIITKSGNTRWLKEIVVYEKTEKGFHLQGYIEDISPFKTGVSFESAFTSYRQAVNSGSIVSLTDKEGLILFANEHFCRVSGYSRQELIGSNHRIINSGIHSKSFFASMWNDILAGKIWRGQICNRAKDGRLYWVDSVISPVLNAQGEAEQFLSIRNVITDQKTKEYNLMESEALNRSVLSSLKANITILDAEGAVLRVNRNWDEPDSVLISSPLLHTVPGSNYFEILEQAAASGTEHAAGIWQGMKDVLSGRLNVFEKECRCGGRKSDHWFLLHVSKFENDVTRLVLSHFDISARKQQEEQVRRSEARLQEAQRIARLGSWELDLSSNELRWSDENYRNFGVDKESFVPGYEQFLELVHPEDREMVSREYQRSVETGEEYNIVHRIMLRDGSVRYINEQCRTFYDENGKALRSVGTSQDITSQKESEILLENQRIQYQNVVENISDGLVIDDIDGHVVFANRQFLSMIGITEKDLSTFVFDDYVADEYKDILRSRHKQRMLGEEVSTDFEYVGLRKDGSRRWFEARVTKIMHGTRIIGTQSAIRDITDARAGVELLKASEAEKTNLIKELNQRYNELMQFNYIVSHNLRAPIANIIGLADMFNMEGVDETERQEIIAHIQSSILKIDELISDLNIILAARSDINSKKEKVRFSEIIQHIEKSLEKQIHDASAVIETSIAANASDIFSIKSFIKSVLYNLINNAIKYRSAQRPPYIVVNIQRKEDQIQIRVEDNGIGLDLDKYGKDIFGLYKRFHHSFEGKGLGLNMSKTQVEALGGSIHVSSHPGEGSVFTVMLPDIPKELSGSGFSL